MGNHVSKSSELGLAQTLESELCPLTWVLMVVELSWYVPWVMTPA